MILISKKNGLPTALLICTVLFFACQKEDIKQAENNTTEIIHPINKKTTNGAQKKLGQENFVLGFVLGDEASSNRNVAQDDSKFKTIVEEIVIDRYRNANSNETQDILENGNETFSWGFIVEEIVIDRYRNADLNGEGDIVPNEDDISSLSSIVEEIVIDRYRTKTIYPH